MTFDIQPYQIEVGTLFWALITQIIITWLVVLLMGMSTKSVKKSNFWTFLAVGLIANTILVVLIITGVLQAIIAYIPFITEQLTR